MNNLLTSTCLTSSLQLQLLFLQGFQPQQWFQQLFQPAQLFPDHLKAEIGNVTMYLMETTDKRLLIDLVLFCCIPLLGEISYYLVNSEVGLDVQQPASVPLGWRAPYGCGYGDSDQVKQGRQLREQAVPPLRLWLNGMGTGRAAGRGTAWQFCSPSSL